MSRSRQRLLSHLCVYLPVRVCLSFLYFRLGRGVIWWDMLWTKLWTGLKMLEQLILTDQEYVEMNSKWTLLTQVTLTHSFPFIQVNGRGSLNPAWSIWEFWCAIRYSVCKLQRIVSNLRPWTTKLPPSHSRSPSLHYFHSIHNEVFYLFLFFCIKWFHSVFSKCQNVKLPVSNKQGISNLH